MNEDLRGRVDGRPRRGQRRTAGLRGRLVGADVPVASAPTAARRSRGHFTAFQFSQTFVGRDDVIFIVCVVVVVVDAVGFVVVVARRWMFDGNDRLNDRYAGFNARLAWSKRNSLSLAHLVHV